MYQALKVISMQGNYWQRSCFKCKKEWIVRHAPFAVNQICHGSNDRLMDDMATCVKHEVLIIITSLRPPAELVEAAHSYGGLVYHDVINVRHAKKAAEQGVDGLILICAGAGIHAGALFHLHLLREVKEWFDGTVILSGSIGDGYSLIIFSIWVQTLHIWAQDLLPQRS